MHENTKIILDFGTSDTLELAMGNFKTEAEQQINIKSKFANYEKVIHYHF